jgi:hypothetical protein
MSVKLKEKNGRWRLLAVVVVVLFATVLRVAILDDGSGDGGPPDPQPPIGPDV